MAAAPAAVPRAHLVTPTPLQVDRHAQQLADLQMEVGRLEQQLAALQPIRRRWRAAWAWVQQGRQRVDR